MKKSSNFWHLLPVIFSLAWPTMLEQLMSTAVQYVDTAMVGVLGTHATAAVGSTSTVSWLINSTVSAIGIGFLSYIAQACGAGNRDLARRATGQVTLVVLLVGTVTTALTLGLSRQIPVWMQTDPAIRDLAAQYFFLLYLPMLPRTASILYGTVLRAVGDTKTPMRLGIVMNLVNVVGNFLLIYPSQTIWGIPVWGAGMGVLGAAVASAGSFLLGGVCITVAVWRHPVLSPKGQRLKPDWAVLRPCLRVALPNMLQRFGTSFGYVAFASMINGLGEVSTAAHTIANTVESAFYIPGFGMQTAAATLTGNAIGARDREKLHDLARMLLILEVALMCLSGGLLYACAPGMMGLFSKSGDVIALGTTVLRMVALSEPLFGIAIILEGMLQGMGKTLRPFVYNILGMWGVRILGTWICTRFLAQGLTAAWACMIAHNILLCVLFSIHYKWGKWDPMEV